MPFELNSRATLCARLRRAPLAAAKGEKRALPRTLPVAPVKIKVPAPCSSSFGNTACASRNPPSACSRQCCAKDACVTSRNGAGTLIFTGATGSVRGSARFSPFAAAKGALRNLAQSVAREFSSKGIHVAHVIVDGVIHGDRANAMIPDLESRFGPDGMLAPDQI